MLVCKGVAKLYLPPLRSFKLLFFPCLWMVRGVSVLSCLSSLLTTWSVYLHYLELPNTSIINNLHKWIPHISLNLPHLRPIFLITFPRFSTFYPDFSHIFSPNLPPTLNPQPHLEDHPTYCSIWLVSGFIFQLPVLPHKAVAKVSKIGNL